MPSSAARRARMQHLLSYLIISLVPILLCGILFIHSLYQQRSAEIEQATLNGLTLMRTGYDYLLQNSSICASHFNAVQGLADASAEAIAGQLAAYQQNYPGFSQIIYYEKGSQNIVDTQGARRYTAFQQGFEGDIDMDMSRIFVSLNETISPLTLRSRSDKASHADGDQVIFMQPVPMLSASPAGTLAFFVPVDHLRKQLDDCVGQPEALYLLADQNLSYIWRSNGRAQALETRLFKLRGTGIFRETVEGKPYLLFRAMSESNLVYHLLAIPEGALLADALTSRREHTLLLCGLVLAVGLAAVGLHMAIYRPIQRMLDLPLPPEETPEAVDNIYLHVRNRVRDVAAQNGRLSIQLEDQRQVMRQQSLHHLLYGYVGRWSASQLAELGLVMPAPSYTVAYGVLEEDSGLTHLTDGQSYSLNGERCYLIVLADIHRVAALINHYGGDAARLGLAEALLTALEADGVRLRRIGMGVAFGRLEDIALSFLQAQAVLHETEDVAPTGIELFETSQRTSLHNAFMPISDKLLLCQCIRNGQNEIAQETLEKMRLDVSALSLSPSLVRSWCFFLYEAVQGCFQELGLTALAERMPKFAVFAAPDALCEQLRVMVEEACQCVDQQERQQKDALYTRLISYVQEHYHEADMSLERLSSIFHLSESFLTRFFRKKTGQSFLQFISSLRMERVKQLLVTTDLPIKDIVSQSGYVDVANFTRKFRQQEGMTPGGYRQAFHASQGQGKEPPQAAAGQS